MEQEQERQNSATMSLAPKESSLPTSSEAEDWLERCKKDAERAAKEEKEAKRRRAVRQAYGKPPKDVDEEKWYEEMWRLLEKIKEKQQERIEQESKAKIDAYNAKMSGHEEKRIDVKGLLKHMRSQAKERYGTRLTATEDQSKELMEAAYRAIVEERGMEVEMDRYTKQAINAVSRWMVAHKKPGLLLRGNVGVGKSTILQAMKNIYSYVDSKGIFVHDSRDIVNMARTKEADYDELVRVKMLGIDDLGTEPLTSKSYGNEQSPITDLLAYRYDKQLFTVITTNLTTRIIDGRSVDEISEIYGERTFDRIKEMCNIVQFDGDQPSYRK